MARRPRSAVLAEWPLSLRLVIRSAELECPSGHADALLDFTALALRKIPARGIFDPAARGDHELFSAIESIARAHLELTEVRAVWRAAIEAADLELERRDEIERAALQVQAVSDTAYFYAGLAFGLTAAWVYR